MRENAIDLYENHIFMFKVEIGEWVDIFVLIWNFFLCYCFTGKLYSMSTLQTYSFSFIMFLKFWGFNWFCPLLKKRGKIKRYLSAVIVLKWFLILKEMIRPRSNFWETLIVKIRIFKFRLFLCMITLLTLLPVSTSYNSTLWLLHHI